jgi:hypothetical protein
MNIKYEFTNLDLKAAPSMDGMEMVITRVYYTYRATDIDSNIYADYEDFHNFELSSNSQFMQFETLTKNDIIGWLEASVDTLPIRPVLSNRVEDYVTSKYVSVKSPWDSDVVESNSTLVEPEVTAAEPEVTTTEPIV